MRPGKGQRHPGKQAGVNLIAADFGLAGDPQPVRNGFQFFLGLAGAHLPVISFCTSTGLTSLAASPNITLWSSEILFKSALSLTMRGVSRIIRLTLLLVLLFVLNSHPRPGISPSKGIL